jgi:glycogen debranching enzyme
VSRLRAIATPLDAQADAVPAVGGASALTVLDGRTFAISDRNGDIRDGVHGFVHADRRHLSRFELAVDGRPLTPIASATPTPFEAIVVHRLRDARGAEAPAIVTRRRTIGGAMREHVELWATDARPASARITMGVSSDFLHIFDVKAGLAGPPAPLSVTDDGAAIAAQDGAWATRVRWDRRPLSVDDGSVTWELTAAPHGRVSLVIIVEPIVHGAPVATTVEVDPAARPIAIWELTPWRQLRPTVTSTDARLVLGVERALADVAALQIRDVDHPARVLVAAGAPWFMTLFGRDSLLTAWMTLPFDSSLAPDILLTLGELRGQRDDPIAEEEPGKILHEVRLEGDGGPFRQRSRYFGSVDSTPLFLMVAAEAVRWGAVDAATLDHLRPAVESAVGWLVARGVPDRFLSYARRNEGGLSNQGWKDSWDGITFADGGLATAPIALVEVQGYAYAALHAAADLAFVRPGWALDADELRRRAETLRQRFNARFWDPQGWFALGLDSDERRIDALTTNPGHALWCGIAEPELADRYLDRLVESELWSGWGLRTLGTSMAAYDPLSYHNGSVWPHDTAICAAGAARYGRWDVVDHIIDGALDAASHFAARPPELFAGIARHDLPVPVSYPASCSPQAWSSASILLLARTMLDLDVTPDGPVVSRPDLGPVEGMGIHGVCAHQRRFDVRIRDGRAWIARRGTT